jgi:uncharacterized membrane protein YdbT with pleckstrin-like domain
MTSTYIHKLMGENEKILMIDRQHWFILISAVLLELIFILIIGSVVTALIMIPSVISPFAGIGYILILVPLISMIRDILDWQNRQYIVTNHRVIQSAGILNKNTTDSSLEKVNDVKLSQSFWGRIFNFGDVEILTASELGVNLFKNIGNPVNFKTTMLNAKMELSEEGGRIQHQETIPEMIGELDQLRQKHIISEEEFQQKKKDLLSKI